MPNFSPPPPTVTALSKEIFLDYGRTETIGKNFYFQFIFLLELPSF